MINSMLKLYLVPVSIEWLADLDGIMKSIEAQAELTPVKCLQSCEIYESRDALQKCQSGTYGAPAFTMVFLLILNQDSYVLMV